MKKLLLCVLLCVAPACGAPQHAGSKRPARAVKLEWPTLKSGPHWDVASFQPGVAAIQYQLRARGFYQGRVDGLFSPKTVAAVKRFQKSRGLYIDGIAGPQTLPRLVIPVRRGARGDAVRAAQILARFAMDHIGGMPNLGLAVDGIYDAATEDAVRQYQACLYLQEPPVAETGVMDLAAWSALLYDFEPPKTLKATPAPTKDLRNAPLAWPTIPANEEFYDGYYSPNLQALQYLLRSRGFFKAPVNGIFGTETTAAIKALQRAKRLPVTGIARQQELQALIVPLKRGDRGDQVRAVQILARAAYGPNDDYPNLGLEADGVYDVQTVEAVRLAQCGVNSESILVPNDGVMGLRSWCVLMGGHAARDQG